MAFCSSCGSPNQNDNYCSKCGKKIDKSLETTGTERTKHVTLPTFDEFQSFRREKEQERRTTFPFSKKGRKCEGRVKITVGLMRCNAGAPKYVRGSGVTLEVLPSSTGGDLIRLAQEKHILLNKGLPDTSYVLLYKDGSLATCIPGTSSPMTLRGYKEFLGFPYQKVPLYICPKTEYEKVQKDSDSDELPEINLDDSWDSSGTPEIKFRKKRTQTNIQRQKDDQPSTSSSMSGAHCLNYSEYITILPDESDDKEDKTVSPLPPLLDKEEDNVQEVVSTTVKDILMDLSQKIKKTEINRFNINRKNVWDGACRGFKITSFSPENTLFVKFTDDEGASEEVFDQGGPRREFLRLLMGSLSQTCMFEGPITSRILALDSQALQRDDYYMAGQMLAICLVHGGPSPKFFSPTLFDALVQGPEKIHVPLDDITNEEVRNAIKRITEAENIHDLQNTLHAEASILTIAGCFHHVKSVEEKYHIAEDLKRWYVLGRTRSAYERLRKGLETLGVLQEIIKHPNLLRNCFIYSPMQPTAAEIESLFIPKMSVVGSSKRLIENTTLGFWRDYIQDAEEKSAKASLSAILIFATGYDSIPPQGFTPSPSVSFIHAEEEGQNFISKFPIANTCANELKLPVVQSYEEFKDNMDFGILNSPSFGRF